MFPTLRQLTPIDVFSRLKLKGLDTIGSLAKVKCENTCGISMTFTMLGRENIIHLMRNFRMDDFVNIVSEGGVIRKFAKGIDLEV